MNISRSTRFQAIAILGVLFAAAGCAKREEDEVPVNDPYQSVREQLVDSIGDKDLGAQLAYASWCFEKSNAVSGKRYDSRMKATFAVDGTFTSEYLIHHADGSGSSTQTSSGSFEGTWRTIDSRSVDILDKDGVVYAAAGFTLIASGDHARIQTPVFWPVVWNGTTWVTPDSIKRCN